MSRCVVRDPFHGLEPIIRIAKLCQHERVVGIPRGIIVLEPMLVACELLFDAEGVSKTGFNVAVEQQYKHKRQSKHVRERDRHSLGFFLLFSTHSNVHRVPLLRSPKTLIWRIGLGWAESSSSVVVADDDEATKMGISLLLPLGMICSDILSMGRRVNKTRTRDRNVKAKKLTELRRGMLMIRSVSSSPLASPEYIIMSLRFASSSFPRLVVAWGCSVVRSVSVVPR